MTHDKAEEVWGRFWKYVDRRSETECWEWTGACSGGYGSFHLRKKTIRAHRLLYELLIGPIPENMCVLHRCDVRNCLNPAHLFLGTNADNIQDKVNKKRQAYGTRVPSVKLCEKDVREIRILIAEKYSLEQIARKFKIGPTAIRKIFHGTTWRHVA